MKEKIKILPGEKLKTVKSLENITSNHYAVSNLGRIVYYKSSPENGYPMPLKDYGNGYLKVNVKTGTSAKSFDIHVLMAETFLFRPPGKDYVIHKDGNLHNNLLTNLKWVSRSERNDYIGQDWMQGWDAGKKTKFELLPDEEWKVIKSLVHIRKARTYAASSMGRIAVFKKTLSDGQLIKPRIIDGYLSIALSHTNGNRKSSMLRRINRLVAECFLPLPGKGEKVVIHKDLKPDNNVASNLKWATQKESLSRHKRSVFKGHSVKNPLRKFVNEKWAPVKSLEGIGKMHYMISSLGRLASYFRSFEEDAQLVKGVNKNRGHKLHRITIKVNGQYIKQTFHFNRIVAECFLQPPEKDQLYLIHLDQNKQNNLPSNLQWVNAEDFDKHFKKSEGYLATINANKKRKGLRRKLTETKVILIKRLLADPNNKFRIKTLAKRFDVHPTTLYEIKNGKK